MKQVARVGLGQGLVVLATFIPVLAKQHYALAAALFCASVAGLVTMPLLGAIPLRIAGVVKPSEVRRMVALCLWVLSGVAVLLFGGFVVIMLTGARGLGASARNEDWELVSVCVGIGLFVLGSGLYAVVSAYLVRTGCLAGIARLRIAYGVMSLGISLGAVYFGDGFFQVIVAGSASAGFSALLVALQYTSVRSVFRQMWLVRPRDYWLVWRTGWRLGVAAAINGFTAQSASMVIPMLGQFGELWAVVLRVGGGFTTVAQTIAGPFVENDLGLAVRQRDYDLFRRGFLRGVLSGGGLALGGVASSLVIVLAYGDGYSSMYIACAMFGALGLFLGQTTMAPVARVCAFAGWQRFQMRWDVARFFAVSIAVLFIGSPQVVSALGLVIAVFAGVFVLNAWRSGRVFMG